MTDDDYVIRPFIRSARPRYHHPTAQIQQLLQAAALLIFFFSAALFRGAAAANITTDANALLAFRSGLTSYGDKLQTWNSPENATAVCSTWFGVGCGGGGVDARVVNLTLGGRALNGTIALASIGSIDSLQILSLRDNSLFGQLPLDLSNCFNLSRIALQNNHFSGNLSPIANLTNLATLLLNNNSFTGALPAWPAPPLRRLNVSYNDLNGSIPSSVAGSFNDSSVFAGNPNLCGPPLSIVCPSAGSPPDSGNSTTAVPAAADSPAQAPPGSNSRGELSRGEIAGIVLGSIFGFILLLSCVWVTALLIAGKKARIAATTKDIGNGIPTAVSSSTAAAAAAGMPTAAAAGVVPSPWDRPNVKQELAFVNNEALFTIEDLLRASAEVLGKGNFGTTYRATLENGREVVVKRLKEVVGEAEEIADIVKRRLGPLATASGSDGSGRHLLPITAYFFTQADQNLILLPFMSGGSLATRLRPAANGRPSVVMEWGERLDLALDVAEAIAYLHDNLVVHGNIKSSNVLIDESGEVRLSEYGLLSIALFSSQLDINVLRTYLAPEVVNNPHRAQTSADTYSFGILLLELLTGKSPNDASILLSDASSDKEAPLVSWVESTINKHENGKAEVFDTQLKTSEQTLGEMEELLDIALTCAAISPSVRPPMDLIVTRIGNIHPPSHSSHVRST